MKNLLILVLFSLPMFVGFSQPENRFGFGRVNDIPVFQGADSLFNPWTGGLNSPQFSTIDLDDDGVEDLFIFDRSTNSVLTFLNLNNTVEPTYLYAPEYEKFFPKMENWALLRDYNCDGKKDIFTSSVGGMTVYRNVGIDSIEFEKAVKGPYLITNHWGNDVNLYSNLMDIPSVTDIDGDGDLDILVFGIFGGTVQYHKNQSMELYGTCDSLNYIVKNDCWGRFTESGSASNIKLFDTLVWPCDGTIADPESPIYEDDGSFERGSRHTGSTLLAFDSNGSGVMDLLIGDVDAQHITLLINEGIDVNTNSAMASKDDNFPSYDQPVQTPLFPAAYFEDFDNDGIRDLIVTTNLPQNSSPVDDSWDKNHIWFYKNTGADNSPIFERQNESFLLDEMINVGRGAYPVMFDYDNDGLKDLIVAHVASSYPNIASKRSSLRLYQNTGTASEPRFTFVTDNFANLHPSVASSELLPCFGDLNGDGEMDLVLGTLNGDLYWKQNLAAPGGTADFSGAVAPLLDKDGSQITTIGSSAPFLVDIDRNGTLDLIIGNAYGKLHYYSNSLSSGYEFTFETNNFGGVNVTSVSEFIGYSVPYVLDVDGEYHLFVGSELGYIHLFDGIEGNVDGTFNRVDSTLAMINTGKRSSIWIEDLNDDDFLEAMVGNFRGGLSLFRESDTIFLSTEHIDPSDFTEDFTFKVYPNPAHGHFTVESAEKTSGKSITMSIYDISGTLVYSKDVESNKQTFNADELSGGIYVVSFSEDSVPFQFTKLIVH